jgi:hypothetical protein
MRQRRGRAGRLAATRTSRKSGGAKKRADERGMTTCDAPATLPIKPATSDDPKKCTTGPPSRVFAQPRAWCCFGVFGRACAYITGATSAVALHDLPRSRPAIRSIPLSTNISPPSFVLFNHVRRPLRPLFVRFGPRPGAWPLPQARPH